MGFKRNRFSLLEIRMRNKCLNILRVYLQATPDELDAGLRWYATVFEECRELDPVNPNVVAGVVAALSPQVRWEANIRAAEDLLAGNVPFGIRYKANIAKAKRIARGESVMDVLGTGGPKTRAFYTCITDRDTREVCIDSHTYSIWYGRYHRSEEIPHLSRRGRYAKISSDYQSVADDLCIKPHQLQACVWLTWRRLHADIVKAPKTELPF